MNGIDSVALNFSPSSLNLLNAILAIVMFSVAIDLTLDDFRALAQRPKALIVGLFSQFLVLPILTFLLILVVQPGASIALGLILVAACPGGNISNFFTHRAGGNTALSVSMTAFSTVMALVMTPLNIAFWGGMYGPSKALLQETSIDPVQVAITVVVMLLLPLMLGLTLNMRRPELTQRLRRPVQGLSMGILIAFIVVALLANWSHFMNLIGAVAGLVVLHNAVALAGGYSTARLAGLSVYNRRAVTIETGIQNSGLGLVLIFAFFGGMGGMAIIAALWGIWHVISGFVLSSLMARTEATR